MKKTNTNTKTLTLEIISGNKISYVKVSGGYQGAKDYIEEHCPDCKLWTIKG